MLKPKWLLLAIPVLMVLMAVSADATYTTLGTEIYFWPDPINIKVKVQEDYAFVDPDGTPDNGDEYYYYLYTIYNSSGTDIYDFHVENKSGVNLSGKLSHPTNWTATDIGGELYWDTNTDAIVNPGPPPVWVNNSQSAIPTGWSLNSFDVAAELSLIPNAGQLHGTVHGWVTDVDGDIIAEGDVSGLTPEPGTLLLLGFGLAGMAVYGWRRKKKES